MDSVALLGFSTVPPLTAVGGLGRPLLVPCSPSAPHTLWVVVLWRRGPNPSDPLLGSYNMTDLAGHAFPTSSSDAGAHPSQKSHRDYPSAHTDSNHETHQALLTIGDNFSSKTSLSKPRKLRQQTKKQQLRFTRTDPIRRNSDKVARTHRIKPPKHGFNSAESEGKFELFQEINATTVGFSSVLEEFPKASNSDRFNLSDVTGPNDFPEDANASDSGWSVTAVPDHLEAKSDETLTPTLQRSSSLEPTIDRRGTWQLSQGQQLWDPMQTQRAGETDRRLPDVEQPRIVVLNNGSLYFKEVSTGI